jgi:hypothetical protein
MLPLLREILTEHKAANGTGPNDPILTTRHGNARNRRNLRQRVVAPVVAKAEELLAQRGGQPLPRGITPAQAQAHVRLGAVRDRQGPDLRDAPARAHRPRVHL